MMVKISFLHYVAAVIHTPNRNTVAGNRAQSGVNNPVFIVGGSWSLYSHVDLLDELLDWRKSLTAVRTAFFSVTGNARHEQAAPVSVVIFGLIFWKRHFEQIHEKIAVSPRQVVHSEHHKWWGDNVTNC